MATSVKALLLIDIVTDLEAISVSNGYNTNIVKVVKGKILDPGTLHPSWRVALAQIRLVRVENTRSDDHLNIARGFFQIMASMDNVTFINFTNFLDDLEDSVSNDMNRGSLTQTAGTYYEVQDTHVESIEIGDTSEFDEVFDTAQEQYKSLMATLIVVVDYNYIPNLLSETASG